jgi:EAL domain-containing protein (putative c-di-GMP-specific phosphodiesterase class I)
LAERENTVSINLSGRSFNNDLIHDFIVDKLSKVNCNSKVICFEVTERFFVTDINRADFFIPSSKKCDCKFSLDDFGSGMATFTQVNAYLTQPRLIRHSFIHELTTLLFS